MAVAVLEANDATTFVCPRCSAQVRLSPHPGCTIVAVYCLHRTDTTGRHAVRMDRADRVDEPHRTDTPGVVAGDRA